MHINFVIPGFGDSVKLSITSAKPGIAQRSRVLISFLSISLVSSIN